MKCVQTTLLSSLLILTIACSAPSPDNSQIIESSDSTQIVDELIEDTKNEIVSEVAQKLPSAFLGSWTTESNLEEFSCEFGFSVSQKNNEIFLSSGTEWGGYEGKSQKVKDYYLVNFVQRSEGESWNAKILLKMVGDNLNVSFTGQESDFQKMYRCPKFN